MTTTRQSGQGIAAWALAGVYTLFWLLGSTHHFFSPEHQHEKQVCRHNPSEKHFHSEEYAAVDCSICHIATSLAELHVTPSLCVKLPELANAKSDFSEKRWVPFSLLYFIQPRAPPLRLA
jgi:hypothetical protein